MSEVIHCYCVRGTFSRVVAVLLDDGQLQMKESGKSVLFVGGIADLSCTKCGFERKLVLDSVPVTV